jgi:alkylhydroperoxidase family enzyme
VAARKFTLGCHTAVAAIVSMSYPLTQEDDMTGTTRIPAAEISGVKGALIKRFAKKSLGRVPSSLGVYWHNQKVLMSMAGIGGKVQKWGACDEQLKSFAHMAVAAQVGCSWCLDFNYFEANNLHLDMDKAREIPRWRQSTAFSPLEREVLEYAEAMTVTPPSVTDEMVARLRDQLGDAAVVELSAVVAFANFTTRPNVAMGIESDGFAAACGLKPLAQPATVGS